MRPIFTWMAMSIVKMIGIGHHIILSGIMEEQLHSPKATAWAAIWEGGMISPFFFDRTVNAEWYIIMLQE